MKSGILPLCAVQITSNVRSLIDPRMDTVILMYAIK